MPRLYLALGTSCALALLTSTVAAKKLEPAPPMPVGYDNPGPEPVNLLPGIVDKLRRRLIDPASMRDMTLCQPKSVPAFAVDSTWVEAEWIAQLTINSKNRFGGYTGSTNYTAYVKRGVVTEVSETPPIAMLIPTVQASYVRTAADCPRVRNSDLQALLAD